ncbi:MAG: hypothetical protein PHO85_02670, partial [Candidatus Cloacimonetes bacterium]|nr:hypothetical protein [Candidatus Cloacimonadota bacterium]
RSVITKRILSLKRESAYKRFSIAHTPYTKKCAALSIPIICTWGNSLAGSDETSQTIHIHRMDIVR